MAFPVTLNGRTYTLADFEGTNYVDGLPDAFEDFVTQAGDIYNSTSTSSVAIGTGSKSFTTADSDKPYQAGTPLRIADAAAPETNFLDCIVTSYSGTALVVDVFGFAGSGTKSNWTINIGGAKTVDGTLAVAQGGTGATSASGARTNLGLGTISTQDADSVDIDGGAIDGVTIGGASAAAGTFTTFTSTGIDDNATSTAITIDASENVGIGTDSPDARLESLASSAGSNIAKFADPANNRSLIFSASSAGSIIKTTENTDEADADRALIFQRGATETMRIDSSGNVGIGTDSPSYRLDTNGEQARIARAHAGGSRSANNSNYWKIGTIKGANQGDRFHLKIIGANGYANATIPVGATEIYVTVDNSSDLEGIFYGVGGGSSSMISDVAWTKSGSDFSIYVKAFSFGSTGVLVDMVTAVASTYWEPANSDTGSTSVPSGGASLEDRVAWYTGGVSRMRIDASGNLLVGTTSPLNSHTIRNTTTVPLSVYRDNGSGGNSIAIFYSDNGGVQTTQCVIRGDGDLENVNNSYLGLSDVSLKENIVDASPQLDDIMAMRVRSYNLKSTGAKHIGVIAQELEQTSPDLVKTNEDGIKSVKYSIMYMKAIKALQEAVTRIETLEAEVAALKGA